MMVKIKMNKTISVYDLKRMMDAGEEFLLLDVRNEVEVNFVNIGGKKIPLHQLPFKFSELNKKQPIVVLCHHGIRSAQAQSFLLDKGFLNVSNLEGGIDQWSLKIDPELPRY